jgi:C1A family cysteine protease
MRSFLSKRGIVPKYGWLKDEPDKSDFRYTAPPEIARNLPEKIDLRPNFSRVYNQGNLNSCTANAIAAAMEFDEIKQKIELPFVPSRLFIYYNERAMEGTIDQDSGAQIRDGIKSVAKLGSCHEKEWPYLEHMLKIEPRKNCFKRARRYKALEYRRLGHNLVQMKSCLASGFPFVFGIKVYSSFEGVAVRRSGHLQMPMPKEKFVGKHAVISAGYDDSKKWFIVRNSWGEGWGIRGYFTIPYKYLLDRSLSADFWTIKVIR